MNLRCVKSEQWTCLTKESFSLLSKLVIVQAYRALAGIWFFRVAKFLCDILLDKFKTIDNHRILPKSVLEGVDEYISERNIQINKHLKNNLFCRPGRRHLQKPSNVPQSCQPPSTLSSTQPKASAAKSKFSNWVSAKTKIICVIYGLFY